MTVQQAIMLALQVSIMLTVFGFGLRATVGDVLYLVRQPSLLARSILATFVIVPVFAVAVTGVFALRDAAEIAIVALALSPIPPLLPQREGKGGGHAAYALGLMVVIGLLSIVITPLLVSVLNLVAVRSITSAPGAIAGIVLKAAVLPLAAGIALHATLPAVAARLAKPVTLIAHIMLVTGGLVVLIGATPQVVPLVGDATLLSLVAFVVAGLAVGHWLGGPLADHRPVLALSTACRHPAIALTLAKANFPDVPQLGATIVLYLLVNLVVGAAYLWWLPRSVTGGIPT